MEALVILSKLEQEYLLRAIESALHVDEPRRLFLWMQGQFQALLPHQVMVALQFGADGELLHIECQHGTVLGAPALARLCDPRHGLVLRLARHCRGGVRLPGMLEAEEGTAADGHALLPFQAELRQQGWSNLLVHGSGLLPGGSSFFALFGMPQKPGARHAYFFELLLPYMHMALLRLSRATVGSGVGNGSDIGADARQDAAPVAPAGPVAAVAGDKAADGPATARPVSAREAQVLFWLREGKSNDEIAQLLGISALTVKNHLQRLYRLLGVSNRTHAISRCMSMRLLERHPAAPAGCALGEIRRSAR
jgi:transcriptional regulator EpsA